MKKLLEITEEVGTREENTSSQAKHGGVVISSAGADVCGKNGPLADKITG